MNDKPVLYLLPGVLCDEQYWRPQVVGLADVAELRVPDYRDCETLRAMAEQVLADAPETFSVCGHSMGGRVAWELLMLAGPRIDKFAVMDTGAHRLQPGEPAKRQILLDLAAQDMNSLMDYWIPPMLHPDRANDEELTGIIRDMGLRYSEKQFRKQILALLAREDQYQYLEKIEQEVLLVCGEQDAWSPVSQHEDLLKHLKRGRLEVIPDCGHMVSIEQPERLNRVLRDWLAS